MSSIREVLRSSCISNSLQCKTFRLHLSTTHEDVQSITVFTPVHQQVVSSCRTMICIITLKHVTQMWNIMICLLLSESEESVWGGSAEDQRSDQLHLPDDREEMHRPNPIRPESRGESTLYVQLFISTLTCRKFSWKQDLNVTWQQVFVSVRSCDPNKNVLFMVTDMFTDSQMWLHSSFMICYNVNYNNSQCQQQLKVEFRLHLNEAFFFSGSGVCDRVHSGDEGSAGGKRRKWRRGQFESVDLFYWSHLSRS